MSDPRQLADDLLRSLELIGEGDWTPQDTLALEATQALLTALDECRRERDEAQGQADRAQRGWVKGQIRFEAMELELRTAEARVDTLESALRQIANEDNDSDDDFLVRGAIARVVLSGGSE